MKSKDDLLTTGDAAIELGVHRSRIYALINSGRLVASRLGDILVIKASDLDAVRVRKPGRPKTGKKTK